MKKLNPGTVLALLALFIAVGGTATAASGLINGKQIKPGTITAKQIKNRTITNAKLAPSARKALRGMRGPAGATGAPGAAGPAGPRGATGATGPAGAVEAFATETIAFALPYDEPSIPLSLDVPAGNYLIQAKLNFISHRSSGTNQVDCTVWTDETHGVDRGTADVGFNEQANLAMIAVAPVEGLIELRCVAWDGPGQANNLKLIAQPLAG